MNLRIKLKTRATLVVVGALVAISALVPTGPVLAEQAGGITLAPAVLYFTVTSQNPKQVKTVSITNNQKVDVTVNLAIKRVDETSGILAPTSPIEDEKQSITLSSPVLAIPAGKTVSADVQVVDSSALRPGGSYFSLVATQTSGAGNAIGFNPAVSAGIFITKEAGAFRKVALTATNIPTLLVGMPSSVTLEFKNIGNVVVVPRGIVLLTANDAETFLAKGVINTESLPVFPGKDIKLKVPVVKIGNNGFLPQKTNVIVQYRFDGTDQTTTFMKPVWFVSVLFLALVSVLAVGLLFSGMIIFKRQKMRQKTVRKSQQETTKNTKTKIEIQTPHDGEKITVRKR